MDWRPTQSKEPPQQQHVGVRPSLPVNQAPPHQVPVFAPLQSSPFNVSNAAMMPVPSQTVFGMPQSFGHQPFAFTPPQLLMGGIPVGPMPQFGGTPHYPQSSPMQSHMIVRPMGQPGFTLDMMSQPPRPNITPSQMMQFIPGFRPNFLGPTDSTVVHDGSLQGVGRPFSPPTSTVRQKRPLNDGDHRVPSPHEQTSGQDNSMYLDRRTFLRGVRSSTMSVEKPVSETQPISIVTQGLGQSHLASPLPTAQLQNIPTVDDKKTAQVAKRRRGEKSVASDQSHNRSGQSLSKEKLPRAAENSLFNKMSVKADLFVEAGRQGTELLKAKILLGDAKESMELVLIFKIGHDEDGNTVLTDHDQKLDTTKINKTALKEVMAFIGLTANEFQELKDALKIQGRVMKDHGLEECPGFNVDLSKAEPVAKTGPFERSFASPEVKPYFWCANSPMYTGKIDDELARYEKVFPGIAMIMRHQMAINQMIDDKRPDTNDPFLGRRVDMKLVRKNLDFVPSLMTQNEFRDLPAQLKNGYLRLAGGDDMVARQMLTADVLRRNVCENLKGRAETDPQAKKLLAELLAAAVVDQPVQRDVVTSSPAPNEDAILRQQLRTRVLSGGDKLSIQNLLPENMDLEDMKFIVDNCELIHSVAAQDLYNDFNANFSSKMAQFQNAFKTAGTPEASVGIFLELSNYLQQALSANLNLRRLLNDEGNFNLGDFTVSIRSQDPFPAASGILVKLGTYAQIVEANPRLLENLFEIFNGPNRRVIQQDWNLVLLMAYEHVRSPTSIPVLREFFENSKVADDFDGIFNVPVYSKKISEAGKERDLRTILPACMQGFVAGQATLAQLLGQPNSFGHDARRNITASPAEAAVTSMMTDNMIFDSSLRQSQLARDMQTLKRSSKGAESLAELGWDVKPVSADVIEVSKGDFKFKMVKGDARKQNWDDEVNRIKLLDFGTAPGAIPEYSNPNKSDFVPVELIQAPSGLLSGTPGKPIVVNVSRHCDVSIREEVVVDSKDSKKEASVVDSKDSKNETSVVDSKDSKDSKKETKKETVIVLKTFDGERFLK